jgi:hypothetical protein
LRRRAGGEAEICNMVVHPACRAGAVGNPVDSICTRPLAGRVTALPAATPCRRRALPAAVPM